MSYAADTTAAPPATPTSAAPAGTSAAAGGHGSESSGAESPSTLSLPPDPDPKPEETISLYSTKAYPIRVEHLDCEQLEDSVRLYESPNTDSFFVELFRFFGNIVVDTIKAPFTS